MNKEVIHLGSGIVLFDSKMHVDASFVIEYIQKLESISQEVHFTETGSGKSVNSSGYIFDTESIRIAPERFIETLPDNKIITDKETEFISSCEDALYKCVVEYCKLFPVAMEAIKWRVRGHIATYRSGQYIGCHSDSAVQSEFGKKPLNQFPIHNTLTATILLTDDYEGGELYFRAWDKMVKPRAGSIVMYPATYVGAHEVLPVMSGLRVSYLQWFCHGYLENGMPEASGHHHFYDYHKWLPNLGADVGIESYHQGAVPINDQNRL